MTFGPPEEIAFEGVADFLQIFVLEWVLKIMKFKHSMIIIYELEARLWKNYLWRDSLGRS